MARFLLVRRQSGGCDYTIDCGVAVTEIEAADIESAVALCQKSALGEDDDLGLRSCEGGLESARLYQLGTEERSLPVSAWLTEYTNLVRGEDPDRKEYERLRRKFER